MVTVLAGAGSLAAGAGGGPAAAGGFLKLALLLVAAWWMVSLFRPRIGGKGGGREKDSVGAWLLLASIVVGLLIATR